MHKVNPDPTFERLSKHLFWEYDRSKLDFEKNPSLVVQRVLEYGMLEDWLIIRDYYGIERIGEIAMQFRNLDSVSLSFISFLSGVPKEKFRCYTMKPFQTGHWDF